jgi:hypothetical protein
MNVLSGGPDPGGGGASGASGARASRTLVADALASDDMGRRGQRREPPPPSRTLDAVHTALQWATVSLSVYAVPVWYHSANLRNRR